MNLTTIAGLVIGFGSIIANLIIEGGNIAAYGALGPAILVFGGSFGAVVVGMTMEEIKTIPARFKRVLTNNNIDLHGTIKTLCDLATRSRRDGILSLEDDIEKMKDPFMKQGLQLCVDGVDSEKLTDAMETEMATIKQYHKDGEEFFKQLGGYAPTLGVIGTVMGLVHMLENLDDAAGMGPAIAMAFIATLYGVTFANLVFLPLGNKLKVMAAAEMLHKKIILQALIGIQSGMSPRLLEQSLNCFLGPGERKEIKAGPEKK